MTKALFAFGLLGAHHGLPAVDVGSLLPGNSQPFERAMSATIGVRLPALFDEVALIRTLWDPWQCPAAQLPLLAWAFSVDIWDETWPSTRKRAVVAEARAFHRRKTTVAGYRMALGYRDAELVRANLPRDGFFAGRAPTVAEHEAWLATLPEIRIHAAVPQVRAGRKGFYAARSVARPVSDVILESRRAALIRDGIVTPLVFAGLRRDAEGRLLSEPEQLVIPAPAARVMRAGGFVGYPAGNARLAGERVIALSFTTGDDGFIPNAISPGLTPVGVTPRLVAEARPAGLGIFANRSRYHRGVRVNDAAQGFYRSIRLADGTAPALSRMRNVLGKTRLRRPRFTAGLLVHAPRPPLRSFEPRGHVARAAPTALVRALETAIAVTQAARDTLFLDLNSTRPLAYRDLRRLAGPVRYGTAVRT